MTLTLAAVLAPLGFTGGLTGALFREFAFTLAGAVDHLRHRRADHHADDGGAPPEAAATAEPLPAHRRPQLRPRRPTGTSGGSSSSLDYRPVTLLMVLALIGATGFMFLKTTTELAPEEDQGALFAIVNAPALRDHATTPSSTPTRSRELTKPTCPEVDDRVLDRRLRRQTNSAASTSGCSRTGPSATAAQAEIQQDIQGRLGAGRRRRGLRLRAADAAGRRRRPADLGGHPVDPRPEPGLRGRRGGQAQGAGVGPLHRRAELARLRRAAGDGHHRPRPRGGAQRAGQRDRHDARPAGRRRLDRRSSTANSNSYDIITQVPRECRDNPEALGDFFVRSRDRRRWCRCQLGGHHRDQRRAGRDRAVQPAQLRDDLGAAAARRLHRRRARRDPATIAQEMLPDGFFIDYSGQSRLEVSEGNTIADRLRASRSSSSTWCSPRSSRASATRSSS